MPCNLSQCAMSLFQLFTLESNDDGEGSVPHSAEDLRGAWLGPAGPGPLSVPGAGGVATSWLPNQDSQWVSPYV